MRSSLLAVAVCGLASLVARPAGACLDKSIVTRVIDAHIGEVQACYQRALARAPTLEGRVLVEWEIAAGGEVGAVKVKHSSAKSPPLEACLLAAIARWKFPPPPGDGSIFVTYPFVFRLAEDSLILGHVRARARARARARGSLTATRRARAPACGLGSPAIAGVQQAR